MRRAHLCTAIGVALALMTPAAAVADIGPVIKPEGPAKTVTPLAKPPTGAPAPQVQPVKHKQPLQHRSAQRTHTSTATSTARTSSTHSKPHKAPVRPKTVSGGRKHPSAARVVRTTRTRTSLPRQIVLFPTRLADVGHDSLPSYDTWPSWVLGAFTLLASAEAFLLVRIARARRFQREALHELTD